MKRCIGLILTAVLAQAQDRALDEEKTLIDSLPDNKNYDDWTTRQTNNATATPTSSSSTSSTTTTTTTTTISATAVATNSTATAVATKPTATVKPVAAKTSPKDCPVLTATKKKLVCANDNCKGNVSSDDKTVLATKYKNSWDVRGFQWNSKSPFFEGRAYLGDP